MLLEIELSDDELSLIGLCACKVKALNIGIHHGFPASTTAINIRGFCEGFRMFDQPVSNCKLITAVTSAVNITPDVKQNKNFN